MSEKQPTPLEAGFWLTAKEKRYVLVICALVLLGIVTRYYYLKAEKSKPYTPVPLQQPENLDE